MDRSRADHCSKTQFQLARFAGEIGEREKIVRTGRIVDVEMMFGRTGDIETEALNLLHQPQFVLHELSRRTPGTRILPKRSVENVHCDYILQKLSSGFA